ncbi:hypothetical protein D6777_03205 [Candidatus Woesearchaeota archaeon]|nr:MAG: hypothetical protein D6777_03205 [Candidatus Woesearchaeota archaeon]
MGLENIISLELCVFDLDGTLHKGKRPEKYRGHSTVDFSFALARKMLVRNPLYLPRYVKGCLDTRYIEKNMKNLGVGKVETDSSMVEVFGTVLNGMPYELLKRAAKKLPKLSYPYAKESVVKLARTVENLAIVTKAFEPLALSYVEWFKANRVDMDVECSWLDVKDGVVRGLAYSYNESKKNKMLRLLERRKVSSVTLFGDTDDDLDMLKATNQKGIDTKVVAVHPKEGYSDKLVKRADYVINSWEAFYNLI